MQRFDFSLILFRTVNNYGYSGFHRNLLITISLGTNNLIEILNTSWLRRLLLVQARIENNIKIHEEIKDSALQIKTTKYTPTESHVSKHLISFIDSINSKVDTKANILLVSRN